MLTPIPGIREEKKDDRMEGIIEAVILDFGFAVWSWQRQYISLSHLHHLPNGNNKLLVECYMK